MRVRWLPVAAESRREQIVYIARRNPRAAVDAGDRIRAAVRLLGQHPAIGRSGRRDGTRELVVSGTRFLIVYRVERDVRHDPAPVPRRAGLAQPAVTFRDGEP